jgi:hypothetical protein
MESNIIIFPFKSLKKRQMFNDIKRSEKGKTWKCPTNVDPLA